MSQPFRDHTMARILCLYGLIAAGMLTGCGGGSTPAKTETPVSKAPEKPASPIVFAAGARPKPPAGCEWAMNQTPLPGDEFLLYMAAKCNGKTKTLFYAGGAHKAELSYAEGGPAVVQMMTAEGGETDAAILRHTREAMDSKAQAAKCSVRLAKNEFWPADAKVVDVSAAEAAKAPKDEPRSACGKYGLNEDAQMFWRVFQGFAWYFDLGQDEMEIDPGSLTIATKDAQGNWTPVKN